MPNTGPDQALVYQFESDYDHMFQQQISRLRDFVRVKTGQIGVMSAFGLLGETQVTDFTGQRHGTTDWHDSPSYRRWAVKSDYMDAQMLDEEDALEVLVDLEMGYAQNSAMAMNTKIDKIIIDAATATAVTGATGTGTAPFNTTEAATDGSGGNQIAVNASGLVLDKMRKARAVFDAREVGLDEMENGNLAPFVWVTSPAGHQDLLEQTEVVSGDYIGVNIVNGREIATRMPLVGGRVTMMMGFRIKISNQLNLSGTDHINLAWHHKAIGLALWGGRRVWVGELPEHRLSRGIIIKEHMGAARIHDRGVLSIVCLP
jgi:hypothetical protein